MWGHLLPILPVIQFGSNGKSDKSDAGVGDKTESLKPLGLPGSFGREELLRPLSKVCYTCISSHRHSGRDKNSATSPAKKRPSSSRPLLSCNFCQSIQSVAKFIPRMDFWCFSFLKSDTVKGMKLQLTISGRNVSQLVRVYSSGGDIRESNNRQKGDQQTMLEVHDGDVVSLLWYDQEISKEGRIDDASSTLNPLVNFRVTKTNDVVTEADVVKRVPDNQVVVSILNDDSPEKSNAKNETVSNTAIGTTGGESERKVIDRNYGSQNDDKKNHPDGVNSDSSCQLWNASDFLNTRIQEEKVAHGNSFRNVRAKYGDNYHANNADAKQLKASNLDSFTPNSDKPLADSGEIGSIMKTSSKEEEEPESAPLTLPSQFLASCSKSFDSIEKSPSQRPKLSASYNELNNGTQQKSNNGSKIMYGDMGHANHHRESTNTPKKSNLTIANTSATAPISSMSYNQLVELHKKTAASNPAGKPSLSHTVLSLTLALTSNASSYDSSFLGNCNAEAKSKHPERQQWMPRLLQGTQITLQKRLHTDHA